MRKRIALLLLLFVLAGCSAKNVEKPKEMSNDAYETSAAGIKADPTLLPEKDTQLELSGPFLILDKRVAPILMKEETFRLKDIAKAYVQIDYNEFCDQYKREALYKKGIVDAASYVIGDQRFENFYGGSTLVFGSKYHGAVADEIGIGASLADVRKTFGDPQFRHEDVHLAGYKTPTFYIAFEGSERVEKIYLSRRYPLETERKEMLENLMESMTNVGYENGEECKKWGMNEVQLWRGSMDYYDRSGLHLLENSERRQIAVYSDFEGIIPATLSIQPEIYFRDLDFPEHKICLAIYEERFIQKQIKEHICYFSPDGKVALIPFEKCTYERSGLLLRWLNGDREDQFVQFGHFPMEPHWLSDRYFGIETNIGGFGIYDLEENKCLVNIESVNPEGIEYQKNEIIVRKDSVSVYLGQEQQEFDLTESQELVFLLKWDANGNLKVGTPFVR